MALACKTAAVRPDPPVYGSYPGCGDAGRPLSGHELAPPITYEGYKITPRSSRHDRGKGKWYQAHTMEMPATLRDLEHMIQSNSLSGRTVLQELYSSRLEGSKREHIESFIRARDALDSERKHDLAYLHLDQYQRHKESKPSKVKTSAMQIILECRIRPRTHSVLPQQPVSPRRSPTSKGGWALSNSTSASSHGTEISAPMKISRPHYLPPYVRQGETIRANNWLSSRSEDNRSHQDTMISPSTTINGDHDSSRCEQARPASPCSTVSSDTMMSESRRRSSSSVSSGNASVTSQTTGENSSNEDSCATITEAEGHSEEFWSLSDTSGRKHLLPSSLCRYLIQSAGYGSPKSMAQHIGKQSSIGTQTDQEINRRDGIRPLLCQPDSHKMSARPVSGKQSQEDLVDPRKASESHSKDHEEPRSDGNREEASEMALYEKPSWMDDLRPVSTPASKDDDIDPLDNSPSVECGSVRKSEISAEPTKLDHRATKATETDDLYPSDRGQKLDSADIDPLQRIPSSTSCITRADEAPPLVRSNITPAAHGVPPARHSQPLTPLRLDTHSQPRKQSEDISPCQRKRVTFSLPSPASTVPSTPILGTPPSSPDSASSSSSELIPSSEPSKTLPPHNNNPTTVFEGPRRPALNRSSHSSTSYTARMRAHEPLPPRSSSCRDLPVREPRQSNRYDRYESDSVPNNRIKATAAAAAKSPLIAQQPHQATEKRLNDGRNSRCPRK